MSPAEITIGLAAVGGLVTVALSIVKLQNGRLARMEALLRQIRDAVGGKPEAEA